MSRLSIGLAITHQDPGHTHFDVFTALLSDIDDSDLRNVHRAQCGRLTMRTEEFNAFVGLLQAGASIAGEVGFNFAGEVYVDVYRHGGSS